MQYIRYIIYKTFQNIWNIFDVWYWGIWYWDILIFKIIQRYIFFQSFASIGRVDLVLIRRWLLERCVVHNNFSFDNLQDYNILHARTFMRNDLGVASNNKLLFGRVESVMCDSFMWWMLLILLSADEAAAGDWAEQSSLNVPRDWLLVWMGLV